MKVRPAHPKSHVAEHAPASEGFGLQLARAVRKVEGPEPKGTRSQRPGPTSTPATAPADDTPRPKAQPPQVIAAQLAQSLVAHVPLHAPPRKPAQAPRAEAPKVVAPERPHVTAPVPLEPSSRPQAVFTPPAREADSKPIAPPPAAAPDWAPRALLDDPTARLSLSPHAVNFVTDGQSLQLRIDHGEVSIRASSELARSLQASEAELRISLAAQGLSLHDGDDDPPHQREEEREDEWT